MLGLFFLFIGVSHFLCVFAFCSGASFTKEHRPTGKLLKRLGTLEGEGDGPERDETLRWMRKLGANRVRGWKFVRRGPLTPAEMQEVQTNIRELFDLCRVCGKKGHFARFCPTAAALKARQRKGIAL